MPSVVGSVTAVHRLTTMETTTTGFWIARSSVSPSVAQLVIWSHSAPTPTTSGSTTAHATCAHHTGLCNLTFQLICMTSS